MMIVFDTIEFFVNNKSHHNNNKIYKVVFKPQKLQKFMNNRKENKLHICFTIASTSINLGTSLKYVKSC